MTDTILSLAVDTALLSGSVDTATELLWQLADTAQAVQQSIREAFSIGGYKDYLKTVRRFGKGLTDELLVMQLSFGSMKAAIADACAPLAAQLVPAINDAIWAVTRFSGNVGQFIRGLQVGITGHDALAESANKAAKEEKKLESSAKSASGALRRSLMGFDQLNRLSRGSGGSSSKSEEDYGSFTPEPISSQVQQVVDRVLALLRPLLQIDLEPLGQALGRLGAAFRDLVRQGAAALEDLWFSVLTPFAAWVLEALAPALTDGLAGALTLVTAATAPLMAGVNALWQSLQPVVSYIASQVIAVIAQWQAAFELLTAVFTQNGPQITGIFQNIATVFSALWGRLQPVLDAMTARFGYSFQQLSSIVSAAAGYVFTALQQLTAALAGAFTGNWAAAWDGVKGVVVSAVNGIIDVINGLLRAVGNGLNRIVSAANSITVSIPAWIPWVGGKTYSPNLSYVSVPQVPHLAAGAVLPANAPFLAVVGDQRHGTNVEAPLATIQQAMLSALEEPMQGNLAGHQATVAVLERILQAVLGIRLGDEQIGQAARRYEQRQYMMQGGVL